jgi:hypothetical protein
MHAYNHHFLSEFIILSSLLVFFVSLFHITFAYDKNVFKSSNDMKITITFLLSFVCISLIQLFLYQHQIFI